MLPKLFDSIPPKVIIGGRDRSAGPPAPSHNGSLKEKTFDEIGAFDYSERIKFPGLMRYEEYRKMLWRTNLHCYFTKPYVTSWSLFEAAACGCPILTNKSMATTGTINLPHSLQVNCFDDIPKSETVSKITKYIATHHSRESYLPAEFSSSFSTRAWQEAINRALSLTKKPNKC